MFNKEQELPSWQKLPVRRDRKHEPLVSKLCVPSEGKKAIFRFIKDLMVFAAMVGYQKNERSPLTNDGISIILETYASDQKDAFIYLLALMTEKNGTCLKDENLLASVKIFEEYCNAGLEEIQLWLDESPGDLEGIDTLSSKIFEQVLENEKAKTKTNESNTADIDVDF